MHKDCEYGTLPLMITCAAHLLPREVTLCIFVNLFTNKSKQHISSYFKTIVPGSPSWVSFYSYFSWVVCRAFHARAPRRRSAGLMLRAEASALGLLGDLPCVLAPHLPPSPRGFAFCPFFFLCRPTCHISSLFPNLCYLLRLALTIPSPLSKSLWAVVPGAAASQALLF